MKEKAVKPIQISGMKREFCLFAMVTLMFVSKYTVVHFLAAEDMDGKTEDEIEMMKMMGFASFDTTKVRAHCCFVCSHKEVQ